MILTRARRRSAGSVFVTALVIALLAGCGAAATSQPTSPGPSPTAVIAQAATGTPGAATSPAAASPSPAAAATFPLTLTDDEGTVVTIAARPAKIVSLTPATTEILFAVGAGSRVTGVTDADDFPPAAKQITQVVKLGAIDIEKIVGLGADLVIAGGNSFNSPDSIAKLRSVGIPVVVVYAPNVAGVFKDIELIGAAVGEPASAQAVVASMQAQVDAVVAAVATAGVPRTRVFYELDATKEIYTFADGIVQDELIGMAGGDPITTGSPTVFSIPLEKVVAADPQLILLGDAAYGTTPAQVKARPGWAVMTAVRSGAIRPIDDTLVSRPGPRIVEALRALAVAINPAIRLPPAPAASPAP